MKLTNKEKSLLVKCISKEMRKTTNNDYYEKLSNLKFKLVNKLVTTTNEYPKNDTRNEHSSQFSLG